MPNHVRPVPDGYHAITPSLTCRNASNAIEFYKRAFDAKELLRIPSPDGKIAHAELKIGDSIIFLSDEFPGMAAAPADSADPGSSLFLYVNNVDSVFQNALAAGARTEMRLQDMFWGDRYGKLVDPFGHHWGVATHVENVSLEEAKQRMQSAYASKAAAGKA
ncbi:MAG TPA: VOC family protein [Candidatus Acidoferrales bacterium]|nr:VOC family protein [Candidatus Acidoferrales bacterium]